MAEPVGCTRLPFRAVPGDTNAFRSGQCLVTQTTSLAVDETVTVVKRVSVKLRTGPTFCKEGGNEICALLGYYAARGGNFLPTFRDHYRYTVRNVPEERRSHLFRG